MNIQSKDSFIDRTLRNLKQSWQAVAGGKYNASAASARPGLPDEDLKEIRRQMLACLQGKGGEVSARARAATLGHIYLALNFEGKKRFLNLLAVDLDVDHLIINQSIEDYRKAVDINARTKLLTKLRQSLEAPRLRLLTQFNESPEGVKFLVNMRADLISLSSGHSDLLALEEDLKSLLTSWFDIGFLELKRITWNLSSAALLEKLIAYEAVHTIESWDDLKNRLESDRRCFAYFHPRMPEEPLIFVEVALVNGMAKNVQSLLNQSAPVIDPNIANTAIFYSISNAQKGLAGISFGHFLIKRVVSQLTREFSGLKMFATLSPIPGFLKWLQKKLANPKFSALNLEETEKVIACVTNPANIPLNKLLLKVFQGHSWIEDKKLSGSLREPLLRLSAHYLINEKGLNGRALDPVAHFHLSNGAIMESLNWMGDVSPNGLKQSAGIMINYLYDLESIEDNHEIYTGEKKIIVSPNIKNLVKV